MVNFGLNSASILGIFLAVAGAALYFLRSVRPELSRDHDIFFAAVGLLCGLILLFQGWRLDPILQFGQFLLSGAAIFFAVETVRLRGATTEQAKRNAPIVDDSEERRVSRTRVYQDAELDQLEPYDDDVQYENKRRLKGYTDSRSNRRSSYEAEEPRTSRSRPPTSDRYRETPPTRKRPSRPSSPPPTETYDAWEEPPQGWEERPPTSRPRRPRPDESPDAYSRPPRRPPSRPAEVAPVDDLDATPTDYVDYQPIDETESDNQNWDSPAKPEQEDTNWEQSKDRDNPIRFDY